MIWYKGQCIPSIQSAEAIAHNRVRHMSRIILCISIVLVSIKLASFLFDIRRYEFNDFIGKPCPTLAYPIVSSTHIAFDAMDNDISHCYCIVIVIAVCDCITSGRYVVVLTCQYSTFITIALSYPLVIFTIIGSSRGNGGIFIIMFHHARSDISNCT